MRLATSGIRAITMLPTDELLFAVLAVMVMVVRVAAVLAVAEAVVARELVGPGGRRERRGDDVKFLLLPSVSAASLLYFCCVAQIRLVTACRIS